ncbi:VCBS repeat-containing protein [Flavisolibacter sp. BT320]|nr:VCBS repeat-containing protein [Flavisolibacter longurius]
MKKIAALLVLLSAGAFYWSGCTNGEEEGYTLAKTHCQSCHLLPEPSLLNKKTWFNHVLPKMGGLLGFERFDNSAYFESGRTHGAMSLTDWNKIVSYYVENAPDSLKGEKPEAITVGIQGMSVSAPQFAVKDPATTFVGINSNTKLLFADGVSQNLYRLSTERTLMDSVKGEKGIVHVREKDSIVAILSMGVLYPSDEKSGKLIVHDLRAGDSRTLLDSLQRPVFAEYSDLNTDGQEDIILCEFGNLSGQLSWYQNKGNTTYQKHVLRALPGAIRTQVVDWNKDNRPDIVAMLAQGDEGIFIYENKGGGKFAESRLLRLHPSYGSNYFELADFNGDGHSDILATNGDNGDYPPILKPYHGIRIYLNDGKNRFQEAVFLPVNGASKAVARDFDGDGDLDIASISYFPDYDSRPSESFLYWENKGGLSFRPFTIKEATAGRWLTMEAGDVDGDGDLDILLGNAKFTLGYIPDWLMKQWNTSAPSLLVIKNLRKG